MESESSPPNDSTPPEDTPDEPATAVPTNETTPVWAQSKPAFPSGDQPAAAVPIKKGDPDWSDAVSSTNGGGPKRPPEWAQTVPTSPGEPLEESQPKDAKWSDAAASAPPAAEEAAVETEAPLTEPPKAVAADALKSTWPPRSDTTPAPPQETDIWPPEPPTERAMPAWPPPSELEDPATPAQVIPVWTNSFEAPPSGTSQPPPADATASTPSTITPEPAPEDEEPASEPAPTITPAPASAAAPTPAPVAQVTQPLAPPVPAPVAPAPTVQPEPAPEPEAAPEPAPVVPPQAGPPARPSWAPNAPSSQPAPAAHTEQAPSFQMPAWAPRVPLASEPGTPTWFSPKEQIPHGTSQQVVTQPAKPVPPSAPTEPVVGGQLPVAQVPPPQPAQTGQPGQPAPTLRAGTGPQQGAAMPTAGSTWQVVEQHGKTDKNPKVAIGPTAEDRSYAEWFAWAKRGGAPASACHAAAQGAFKALSSGKDVATAVQWATAAMSRPPENVSYARQQYCAWFALANIDLNLDQHRAHAFAGAAVQALDSGMDASAAHAAGLVAAGIR